MIYIEFSLTLVATIGATLLIRSMHSQCLLIHTYYNIPTKKYPIMTNIFLCVLMSSFSEKVYRAHHENTTVCIIYLWVFIIHVWWHKYKETNFIPTINIPCNTYKMIRFTNKYYNFDKMEVV